MFLQEVTNSKIPLKQKKPHINKVKQFKLFCSLRSVCPFSRGDKDSLSEDLYLLIEIPSTKLQTAPLKVPSECLFVGPGSGVKVNYGARSKTCDKRLKQ